MTIIINQNKNFNLMKLSVMSLKVRSKNFPKKVLTDNKLSKSSMPLLKKVSCTTFAPTAKTSHPVFGK